MENKKGRRERAENIGRTEKGRELKGKNYLGEIRKNEAIRK